MKITINGTTFTSDEWGNWTYTDATGATLTVDSTMTEALSYLEDGYYQWQES